MVRGTRNFVVRPLHQCVAIRCAAFLLAATLVQAVVQAGEIRLKNGTVLNGNLWLLGKMGDPPTGLGRRLTPEDTAPAPQNIVLVDNGWQKYYVPRRQIPDDQIDKDIVPSRPESFSFTLVKSNQSRVIASVGSVVDVSPFNEFGQRTITLASAKGNLDIVQAVSRIEPDHVVLDALNYNWQMGVSLQTLPHDVLVRLLRQKVKRNDVAARFALVRFFMQADLYPDAFAELDTITMEFPDQQARAELIRTELMDYFGREVLRELGRRRKAGQHQLAYQYAQRLTSQKLSGSVADDVKKFLSEYDDMVKSADRAKNLLAEWQARIQKPDLVAALQPLRAEINEQLNVSTLPRLTPFLQSESDTQLTAEQRLALAYSGWVVGPENAITDLERAVRYWDARFLILEALRADTLQDRELRYQELRRVEGVGPNVVKQLTALLPPIHDAGDIRPGLVQRIQITPEGQTPAIAYSVVLPPEYHTHHQYPLLIALRPRERSGEAALSWWCGSVDQPGPALRRGYIVIAPEYAEERQSEYSYSAVAHQVVLESLRDARRRFSVDSQRVFLTGHGMGADAAFDLGMAHPDEFAGVIPIGGECQHYPRITYMNGKYTSWYVVGRGFNADPREAGNPAVQRDSGNDRIFTDIFIRGSQFDFLLVEYLGRGVDRYQEEVPRLFDWMDLHRRSPPPREYKIESLRKTDNRQFWLTVLDLPTTTILPPPPGAPPRISPMEIAPRVNEANTIQIKAPAKRFVIRLSPELVDFEKRVKVIKDGRQLFNGFVTPEIQVMLDELRATGDRSRIPLAILDL